MQISVGASVLTPRPIRPPSGPAVILALGQSNMVDRSGADATAVWPDSVRIFDPVSEEVVLPTKNLNWLPSVPGATTDFDSGPGHAIRVFAGLWCAQNPDRLLYVLPAARGGTGFKDEWYADGSGILYNETVRLLDALLGQIPDAEIVAGVMQNGERDAGQQNACYQWNAIEMIARLRTRYDQDIPFVWGEPGQFSATQSADFSRIRGQIRGLPEQVPGVACSRDQNPALYDSLSDTGDGLHFDRAGQEALGQMDLEALSSLSGPVSLPDVALVWQSAGIPNWNNFDIAAYDLQAGDRLVFLAAAHRSSGNAYFENMEVDGASASILHTSVHEVTTRLALSAATVTLTDTPASPLLPAEISWEKQPLGGAISVWRVRGKNVGVPQVSVGTGALTLAGAENGEMVLLAYGVDTAGEVVFDGGGETVVSGAGNVYATSFSSQRINATGEVVLTPQGTPSHGCGVIGLPLLS
ncbi:sialate O-acetylesterase [Donghicola sp. XS_ASV15]|uniref:sialate O-acetylesterase n=1 Tax=Donghicola sp. XS_ASV15 TaxID=3241295 RepID=UPI0035183C6F